MHDFRNKTNAQILESLGKLGNKTCGIFHKDQVQRGVHLHINIPQKGLLSVRKIIAIAALVCLQDLFSCKNENQNYKIEKVRLSIDGKALDSLEPNKKDSAVYSNKTPLKKMATAR